MPPMLIPHQAPLLLLQTPLSFCKSGTSLPLPTALCATATGHVDQSPCRVYRPRRQAKESREGYQPPSGQVPEASPMSSDNSWGEAGMEASGLAFPRAGGQPKSLGKSPLLSLAALTDNPLPLALWANSNVLSTVSPYPAPWGEGESATSSLWSLQRGKGQCGHPNFLHCSIRGGLIHHSPFREPSHCIPPRADQGLSP